MVHAEGAEWRSDRVIESEFRSQKGGPGMCRGGKDHLVIVCFIGHLVTLEITIVNRACRMGWRAGQAALKTPRGPPEVYFRDNKANID